MGTPAASGTLAGSTSGSSASNHQEATGSEFSRLRRHPRVVGLAHLCRPSRSPTSSSGTTPQPSEKQQSEIGVTGGATCVRQGGSTPRARGRLSAAAGCGEHTFRWSPTVTTNEVDATIGTVANRSRRPAAAHDCSPSKPITSVDRRRASETGREHPFAQAAGDARIRGDAQAGRHG